MKVNILPLTTTSRIEEILIGTTIAAICNESRRAIACQRTRCTVEIKCCTALVIRTTQRSVLFLLNFGNSFLKSKG